MKKINKGGPGSGRRPGVEPRRTVQSGGGAFGHGRSTKPNNYSEQPSSRNPGAPRAGIRPADHNPYGRHDDGTPRGMNDIRKRR